jgi:hypothetical protein
MYGKGADLTPKEGLALYLLGQRAYTVLPDLRGRDGPAGTDPVAGEA